MTHPSAQRPMVRSRMPSRAVLTLVPVLLITGLIAGPSPLAAEPSDDSAVVPIDWGSFDARTPQDDDARRIQQILLNSNKYLLGNWYERAHGGQTEGYLDFGGIGEHDIRPNASAALALAVPLSLNVYDSAHTGVPRNEAEAMTIRLITSLAHRHRATTEGGWGDQWQSALWAYYAGFAGWLMWDELLPSERDMVAEMVEYEANRFVGYQVPYYRDASGDIVSPGDTKAEENAWNAQLVNLATAMMPQHPNWRLWMDKNLELMISSFSRPSDVTSDRPINGKRLADWLDGSNINEDGTLVNHGFIHPEYATTAAFNLTSALAYSLADMPTPEAASFNTDIIYAGLVDLEFPSPPYDPPGGTIYIDGSPDIYYPEGTDWGTHRRMIFGLMDVLAGAYGVDDDVSEKAKVWESLHMGMVLDMQERFDDGRTYGDRSEKTYGYPEGREQFTAVQAGLAYLTKWTTDQGAFRRTNRAFPVLPKDTVRTRTSLSIDGPSLVSRGEEQAFTTVLRNNTEGALTNVAIELDVPSGWSSYATTVREFRAVDPGDSVTVTWSVSPPKDETRGSYTLRAEARFNALGEEGHTLDRTTDVIVPSDHNGTETPGVVYEQSNEWQWSLVNTLEGGSPDHGFGYGPTSCEHTITGDWNGDGRATPGIVCAAGGEWRWRLSNANAVSSPVYDFRYGPTSCPPVAGDWNGDGTTTPGIVCPSGDSWRWRLSNANAVSAPAYQFVFGSRAAVPVVGDWNGDGRDTIGVARDGGTLLRWQLKDINSEGPASHDFYFGEAETEPVTGDWDGSGITTVGIVKSQDARLHWRLLNGHAASDAVTEVVFGNDGDRPIVGDWDGQ